MDALWRARSDPEEARWILNRLAAELRGIRRALIATNHPAWWNFVTTDDIAVVDQLAHTWSQDDPDIAVMEQRLLANLDDGRQDFPAAVATYAGVGR